jgi:hypothetical protein
MKYKIILTIAFAIATVIAHGQNPFQAMNNGLEDTRRTIENGNNAVLASMDTTKPVYADLYRKCMIVHTKADSMVNYIQQLKIMLIVASDGDSLAVKNGISLAEVKYKDDYDTPTKLMVNNGSGSQLKRAMGLFKNYCIGIIDKADVAGVKFTINVLDPVLDPDEPEITLWEQAIFHHTPLAAAITHLSKLQGDVRNDESTVILYLYNKTVK